MAQQKKQPTPAAKTTVKPVAAGQRPPAQPRADKQPNNNLPFIIAFVLGAIALFAYLNTLGLDYALDDFTVIKNNSIVTKGMSAIPEILATPYRRGWFITTNDLYRPLSLVMFAIEWQLGGGEAGAGHFMNVIVYAGCVIALFLFLYRFFDGKRMAAAAIATLLFALHPIHTEVVANIKSRDELLCFFFAFLSLNVLLKYMKDGKIQQLLLGAFFFFLSYMSKETVISFLFVVPFIFFAYKNDNRQRSIYIAVSAVVVTGLFLVIRYLVLHAYNANTTSEVSFIDNFLTKAPNPASAFATEVLILGDYLKLLVFPNPLVCDYCFNSIPFTNFSNIWVILSLVIYLALATVSIYRFVKIPKDPYAFAILFFLSTVALFSNIPFLIGAAMAERFVFFASVGFCLAIALLIEQFLLQKTETTFADLQNGKVLAVVVPIALIFAFIVVGRNGDWASNYTLFKADVKKNPENSRLNYYLGTEIIATLVKSEGNPERRKELVNEAIPYLRKSLAIYPEYTDGNASLGDAFFQLAMMGKPQLYDSAEYYDKRSLATNPKFTVAINNLAGVYFMQKQYGKALEVCRSAIVLNPGYVNAYSNLGLCYMNLGMYDSSLYSLYKAISIDPTFKQAYGNLALTFKAMGKPDSAMKYDAMAK